MMHAIALFKRERSQILLSRIRHFIDDRMRTCRDYRAIALLAVQHGCLPRWPVFIANRPIPQSTFGFVGKRSYENHRREWRPPRRASLELDLTVLGIWIAVTTQAD